MMSRIPGLDFSKLPYEAKLALSAILAKKEKNRRLLGVGLPNPWLKYQNDPVGFVEQGLNEYLWSKQEEIFSAVARYDRVAVKSCHSTGKSWGAARLAGWWIASHEPGEAFVVTSAPTFAQVRAILWREINRVHRKGNLPGYTNQTEWWLNNEIVAFGRKPDDENITAFQGIHARYILVILDEGCGIPAPIYNAAETLVSNGGKIVTIGNPDDPLTEFYRICEPGSGWHVITVSAFDTPNFTGEDVPQALKDLLIHPDWVEQRKRRWGETSPLYISKILGDFPEVSVDSLVPIGLVRAAMNRVLEPDRESPNDLGVDVARKGNNESVIYHRHGPIAKLIGVFHKNDLMELTGWVVQAIRETGANRVKIDDPGMGGGVTDRLKELRSEGMLPKWVHIVPVNVGLGPTEKDPLKKRFFNLKSELSWELRDLFETGKIQLAFSEQQQEDGTADDTVAQITAMKYRVMSNGLLRVASKEEMEKELAEINTDLESTSPDRWDALVLAFAEDAPVDKLSSWRKLTNSME
jgi:hypothetical protein